MSIEVDTASFPLVYFRFTGETTMEDARVMMQQQDELLTRAAAEGVRLFVISDNTATTKTSPEVRKYLGDAARSVSDQYHQHLASFVIIASNMLVRGAITAIGWVAPERIKRVKAAKDFEEAVAIMRQKAEEAGLAFPEAELLTLRGRIGASLAASG